MLIGDVIQQKRRARGLTQAELARGTRLSQPNLSDIEKGKRDITVTTLLSIARALQIHPREFFEEASQEAHPLKLSRSKIEVLARVICRPHQKWKLPELEKKVVFCFRRLVPGILARPRTKKEIESAWQKLRTLLSKQEIEALHARVRDELARIHP